MNTTCILFDLDGTLVDTAPDLGFALNSLLSEEGRQPLPNNVIRPYASRGARGLLNIGFSIDEDHPEYGPLRQRFLDIYQDNLCNDSHLFDGMHEVLTTLAQQGLCWGVATNKPAWLANPLLQALDLPSPPDCVVGADQVPRPKPDPAMLELACELAGQPATHCLYVGDAKRDIVAGRRAGMRTVAAAYGYLDADDSAERWGADYVVETPLQILEHLVEEAA